MEERLQKIISASGIMSRRAAEECIKAGRVTVNGHVAELGEKADPAKDDIRVDGQRAGVHESLTYVMLNKPKGYVTTMHDDLGRKCVTELVADAGERLYPVGRLDLNSEGLLILTNDGDFANRMMHPSHNVDKVYRVHVTGSYFEKAVEALRQPMFIDGYKIRPASVQLLREVNGEAILDITIHEGRNRQVRKMCEQVGLTVKKLCRIREGSLSLGTLHTGQWRYLSEREVRDLLASETKNG